jgi:hypothetical protein
MRCIGKRDAAQYIYFLKKKNDQEAHVPTLIASWAWRAVRRYLRMACCSSGWCNQVVFCHTINIQATLDSITNTNLKSEFFAYTVMMLRCYPLADVGLICRPRRIFISPHRATPNRNNHRPHSWHHHILGTSLPAYYLSIDALALNYRVIL